MLISVFWVYRVVNAEVEFELCDGVSAFCRAIISWRSVCSGKLFRVFAFSRTITPLIMFLSRYIIMMF